MIRVKSILMTTGVTLALTACGGGGSAGTSAPTPMPGSTTPSSTISNQRVERGTFDYDANGVPDAYESYAYDANGRPTQRQYVYVIDGTPDLDKSNSRINETQTSTYDDAGNLLTNETKRGDRSSSRVELVYGGDGLLSHMDVTELDRVGALVSKERFVYRYESGRLFEMVVQDEAGTPLLRQTMTYGSDGMPAFTESATLVGPAASNSRTEYEWNADKTIRAKRFDLDSDGVYEEVFTYEHVAGRLMRSVKTHGGSYAAVPGAATYTFTYDAAGQLQRVDTDFDSNGSVESTHTVAYSSGPCSAFKMSMLLPLVTSTGFGSSADGRANTCGI